MSVYKQKNSPYWKYDFVWKGRRFHGTTGCKSRRDALAFEARERHKVVLPTRESPPISVDEACGLYQDKVEGQPSWPTTRYMLTALVSSLGAGNLLSEVTQRHLLAFVGERRSGRSNATVNREIDTCRAVWRWAEKARYDIGEMPDWGALLLPVGHRDPRELSRAEEPQLFEHIRNDLHDVTLFALLTGWRKSEVTGLRWSDVDVDAAVAQTRIKGGDTVKRPLTQAMITILVNQPKAGPFIFTYICQKSRGKRLKGERYPITATALRKPWAEALVAAGIQQFRFHDLRHTRGTRILRATGNLVAAKEALKHKNIRTTLRYAHAADDDIRKALEASTSRTTPEASSKGSGKHQHLQVVSSRR